MGNSATRLERAQHPSPESIRDGLSGGGRLTADAERCPTCHATIRSRFCSRCGARAPSRLPASVGAFVRRAVERLLDADSRFLRSLHLLFVQPGALTVHYLRGNRQPYVGPVQLFAMVNVLIVLLGAYGFMEVFNTSLRLHVSAVSFYHTNMAERWVHTRIGAPEGWDLRQAQALEDSGDALSGVDEHGRAPSVEASLEALDAFRAYETRFDQQADWLSKSLVFLLIPMLLTLLAVLNFGTVRHEPRDGLLPPLVQATHVTTFWLLALLLTAILTVVAFGVIEAMGIVDRDTLGAFQDPVWTFLSCAVVCGYVILSIRRVYTTSWLGAVVRGAVVGALLIPCLQIYRAILFVVGFYTT
ncbi:DUF3667 domain-containing protein [Longibacter sp.]|uniref:DUF3667 domain-containing protein n=1 Tax=Longibacter sp. TaxID=2045415 RepID=UPI003EB9F03F